MRLPSRNFPSPRSAAISAADAVARSFSPGSSSSTRRATPLSSSLRPSDRHSMANDISSMALSGSSAIAFWNQEIAFSFSPRPTCCSARSIRAAASPPTLRQRIARATGEELHQVLVTEPARVEPLRFAERGQRLAVPVLVEVRQPEQVVGLLEGRVEPDRLAQALHRVSAAAHLVEAVSEQVEGLGDGIDLAGPDQVGDRARQLPVRGVDRAQAEVRQEGVRVLRHGLAQERLGARRLSALMADHAREDQRLEVVRVHLEDAREVAQGLLGLAFVEGGLAQEEGQLVVVAVELERLLEAEPRPFDVEREQGVLGVLQVLHEDLAAVPLVERGDAVAGRRRSARASRARATGTPSSLATGRPTPRRRSGAGARAARAGSRSRSG